MFGFNARINQDFFGVFYKGGIIGTGVYDVGDGKLKSGLNAFTKGGIGLVQNLAQVSERLGRVVADSFCKKPKTVERRPTS